MIKLIAFVFTLVLFISCRQSESLSEKDKKDIIIEVNETLNNYFRDVRKSGLAAEFKYLDTSEDFFWVPPGYSGAISFDSVKFILNQNAPKYRFIENSFDTLRIVPLSENLAGYTAIIHSNMTDTSGIKMSFQLVETGILIKRKTGWKLLNGQTSIIK